MKTNGDDLLDKATVLKTIGVAIFMTVLTGVIHELVTFGVAIDHSITGEPIVPLLLGMVFLQAVFLVVAYNLVKEHIPASAGWKRGLVFAVFFAVSIQFPSVFGMIGFEPGHDWELFTPAKVSNYIVVFDDVLGFLISGVVIGVVFPVTKRRPYQIGNADLLAAALGAVVFPCAMWASMKAATPILLWVDSSRQLPDSVWFALVFYGIFFMTGACVPLLHAVAKQSGLQTRWRRVAHTTWVFALLWLPVQNFMFVFGWSPLGGMAFSTLSMLPVVAVVWLADVLMERRPLVA